MTAHPPLAAAAGDATTAARLAAAGIDVVAYHSSALRARGLPSVAGLLPWTNANEMTVEILRDIGREVQLLDHGGPLGDPAAFARLCRGTRYGFFGASVFESAPDLPTTVQDWRRVVTA
jgi:predicted TIM-barrel enzyme